MKMTERMKLFSPTLLRIGISFVFLWFGSQQLLFTNQWISLIPGWIISASHLSAYTVVLFNGAFEIVFGVALFLGLYTRAMAFLLALHILSITLDVGYGAIGVRDFGLTVATFSIFLNGADRYSSDAVIAKNKERVDTFGA